MQWNWWFLSLYPLLVLFWFIFFWVIRMGGEGKFPSCGSPHTTIKRPPLSDLSLRHVSGWPLSKRNLVTCQGVVSTLRSQLLEGVTTMTIKLNLLTCLLVRWSSAIHIGSWWGCRGTVSPGLLSSTVPQCPRGGAYIQALKWAHCSCLFDIVWESVPLISHSRAEEIVPELVVKSLFR